MATKTYKRRCEAGCDRTESKALPVLPRATKMHGVLDMCEECATRERAKGKLVAGQ